MHFRLAALALIFACSVTRASILLEPYGGYSVGTVSLASASQADTGSINGFGYGGRAGFLFNHFALVAVEYQGLSAKQKLDAQAASVSWNQATWFGTLGFQTPFGLRLMGSYGWDLQADQGGTTPTHFKGTAMKLGIGWRLLNEVAINVEYSVYNLTDYKQNNTTGPISDLYSKFNYSATMATLSLPMTFFHFGGGGGHNKSRGD